MKTYVICVSFITETTYNNNISLLEGVLIHFHDFTELWIIIEFTDYS